MRQRGHVESMMEKKIRGNESTSVFPIALPHCTVRILVIITLF